MKDIGAIAGFYKNRFGHPGVYGIKQPAAGELRLSIVIPCYDEDPRCVLESLGQNAAAEGQVEVILVFNHSEKAVEEVRQLHQEQTLYWHGKRLSNEVPVYTIAAFDLPHKHAGVGLARKIGMDIALQRFADAGHNGLIVCLDADCKVSANYLSSLFAAERSNAKGLSIAFKHRLQEIPDAAVKQRITDYEIWLRYYVQALRFAGYPHAYHTIGSSMAVRASAYAKIGGMNRRKAGEDFYFLHKLIPHGKLYDLTECCVYPSARISERVPFGTGRAMLEMEEGTKDFLQVYHHTIFLDLRDWLNLEPAILDLETDSWPQCIAEAARELGWLPQMEVLAKRSANAKSKEHNFFHWLDGFKMLKLVHHLRDEYFGLEPAFEAGKKLHDFAGGDREELLKYYRKLDFNSGHTYFYSDELQST